MVPAAHPHPEIPPPPGSGRHWQITLFCDNRVQQLFYHSITKFVFSISSGSEAICHFSRKSDRKKEESVGSFTHEQNIICTLGTRGLFIACDERLRWPEADTSSAETGNRA